MFSRYYSVFQVLLTVVPDVLGVLIILFLVDLEFVFLFYLSVIRNTIPVVSPSTRLA